MTESERPREAVLRPGTGRIVAVASIAKNYKRDPIMPSAAQSASTTPGGEAWSCSGSATWCAPGSRPEAALSGLRIDRRGLMCRRS